MIGDTFWNYDFCFVLLCYKEAVKIFIRIEIMVENISRFNMYGKVVICHYVLSFVRYKESNKLSVVVIRWEKVTCLNKVFIDNTIEKFTLVGNRSFIKASSLIFSRTSSSSSFLFTNPSFKISSASGPNIFARPSTSLSFGGSLGSS